MYTSPGTATATAVVHVLVFLQPHGMRHIFDLVLLSGSCLQHIDLTVNCTAAVYSVSAPLLRHGALLCTTQVHLTSWGGFQRHKAAKVYPAVSSPSGNSCAFGLLCRCSGERRFRARYTLFLVVRSVSMEPTDVVHLRSDGQTHIRVVVWAIVIVPTAPLNTSGGHRTSKYVLQ